MLRGIYSVASSMEAATRNHEIAAENLSHCATPGYRRQGTFFEITATANNLESATQDLGNVGNPVGYTNFETGPIQQTSNPYDLAVTGNGFFVLDGPNGPLYTRNGSFERGPNGELQSRSGPFRVRGLGGGTITVPPDAIKIDVSPDGTVFASGSQIGQLQLASFDRPQTLRRAGTTLFEGDDPQTPEAGAVRVEQGYREGSNVQPVQEMVSMMIGMRHYEAAERALRGLSDAVAQNTRSQQ